MSATIPAVPAPIVSTPIQPPVTGLSDLTTLRIYAQTMWGEARGGGLAAMEDVGCVILRRVVIGGSWGSSVAAVCQAPWQFSSWNENDPNRDKMRAVTIADPSFALAMHAAALGLAGKLVDRTGGADSYFAVGIPTPYWARDPRSHHTATIWRHTFWQTRTPSAPRSNISAHVTMTPAELSDADILNARSLAAIQAGNMGHV